MVASHAQGEWPRDLVPAGHPALADASPSRHPSHEPKGGPLLSHHEFVEPGAGPDSFLGGNGVVAGAHDWIAPARGYFVAGARSGAGMVAGDSTADGFPVAEQSLDVRRIFGIGNVTHFGADGHGEVC